MRTLEEPQLLIKQFHPPAVGAVCVLDAGVSAQLGRDAGELVAADDDHLEGGDVGETMRQVG